MSEKEIYLKINLKYIIISAFLYLIIPIIVFFITWLRLVVGIPVVVALLIGFSTLIKNEINNFDKVINIPVRSMLLVAVLFLFWTIIDGQGGFFYQTWDHHWRNAIFRDLINYDWPVIYSRTGNGLVYYIMHWIVPAIFGKLFGWTIGNIALLIWTYIGILLSFLLVIYYCKFFTPNKVLFAGLLFITWSGLNGVGMVTMDVLGLHQFGMNSADGWLDMIPTTYPYAYQYSTNDTLLAWVFNQTIATWVVVPLLLNIRKIKYFAFIGLCLLPYAPLPFIGLVILLFIIALPVCFDHIRKKEYPLLLREIFSLPNLSAIVSIFLVFFLYFKCNVAGGSLGLYTPIESFDIQRILLLMLFYLLEFGLYMLLIQEEYKKDILFYAIAISLVIIPLFKIGLGRDFCMRASIPAFFSLMILVMIYIGKMREIIEKRLINIVLLIIVITLGATNPLLGIADRINAVNESGAPIIADNIKSFENRNIRDRCMGTTLENFIVPNPEEKIFYKYLAK